MNFNAPFMRRGKYRRVTLPTQRAAKVERRHWLVQCCAVLLLLGSVLPAAAQTNLQPSRPSAHPNSLRHPASTPTSSESRRPAPTVSVPPNVAADQLAISQGAEFEKQGRWGEALALYQRAVKNHPNSQKLRKRRNIARLHFDLERRYGDSGFLQGLRKSNGAAALQVYNDVLTKIQSYYVDQPNWQSLVNHGAASLEIAIYDKSFREKNIGHNVTADQLRTALNAIRTTLKNFPVKSRKDAYLVASSVSRTLQTQLGVPMQSSVYEFVSGTVVALDPYSSFMTASQYAETMSQIEGNFVGLGVELKTQKDSLNIVDVLKGGPAQQSGLKGGDKIVAVEDRSVQSLGSEVAADMLRGPENSQIVLTIERRDGARHRLQLQRRRVEIQSVEDVRLIDQQNGIGYIRLTNFQKTTTRDFDAALWNLHRQGMKSLVVDVRDNPGGLLSASVEIADRFVTNGVIVSTRGRNPLEDFTHRAKLSGTWRVPLIVLIDENSASASEIFAAAVSESGSGMVIGRQSYGKGSVQGIFPLNISGGGIRLTTAKFYSPTGMAISQRGVKPHVEVQVVLKPSEDGNSEKEDAVLKTALRLARKNLLSRSSAGKGR